jgi:multiphosphoryl transfer protein
MTYTVPSAQTTSTDVSLVAPLSGRLIPIEKVPDPVFAEKMVGDGISIDPVSQTLLAPCDGEVVQLHPSSHAVTIKTADGLEVLMHIGLDTVTLRGEGFQPKVKVGDRVRVGDPLIDFDADYVALHARSLLTQIVITNSDQVAKFDAYSGNVTVGKDVILTLTLAGTGDTTAVQMGAAVTSAPIIVPNPTGLHARPAAVLVSLAKKYQSNIRLRRGEKEVSARSVVGLMGLEVAHGDTVQLIAAGTDADAAIAELSEALRSGLGEEGAKPISAMSSIATLEAAPPTALR